jgi:hypothetical protein
VFSIFYLFLPFAALLADHRGDPSFDSDLVSRRETRRYGHVHSPHVYTPYQSRTQHMASLRAKLSQLLAGVLGRRIEFKRAAEVRGGTAAVA